MDGVMDIASLAGNCIFGSVLAVQYARRKLKRRAKIDTYGNPETIRKIAVIDTALDTLAHELQVRADSCRVVVYIFQNGDYSYVGSPIQKMVAEYESVKEGFTSIRDTVHKVSKMGVFLNLMITDTPLIQIVNELPDSFVKTRFQELDVSYFGVVPLWQYLAYGEKKAIGCVSVHWVNLPRDEQWITEEIERAVRIIEQKLMERYENSVS